MTKAQYERNLNLINRISALYASSFFVAYAVPFWLGTGLSQQEIYLLQAVFTLVMIVLEIPTGMIADKFGRRRSLIASGVITMFGYGFYSLAHGFWQFALAETMLAIGISLNSGTIQAMRHESTIASGNSGRRTAGTNQAFNMLGAGITAGLSGVVVQHFGMRTTMLFDGLTYLLATVIAFRLSEPPHLASRKRVKLHTYWPLLIKLIGLICLLALLSEATHITLYLNARIIQAADINISKLGIIFACMNILGAITAYFGHNLEARVGEKGIALILVSVILIAFLATGLLPIAIAPLIILLFPMARALTKPFIDHALNSRIHDDSVRATVNSCATLVARVLYLVAGPLVGGIVDSQGIQSGYLVTGIAFGVLAMGALWKSFNQLERR